MPRKVIPSHPFGKRLVQLRYERGLTQTQLAELIGSTQKNISHYETVGKLPPAVVVIKLAEALEVSTDQLLGLAPQKPTKQKQPAPIHDPESRRLWKKFQQVRALADKDQRAVIRLINSLVAARSAS